MFEDIIAFRKRLDAGHFCLGSGITFHDPAVTEALGKSVDFVWIDMEHTPCGPETLQAHLLAARATGTPALVRVPGSETSFIKPVLDIGAEAIIVPQVRSAEEVRGVVRDCRYPPQGKRGYGPRRPSGYGRDGGPDYLARANQHLFVVAQIETASACQEIEQIVSLPGLDSIVMGPNDLAGSLGRPGEPHHPEVIAMIEHVVGTARKAGKYVGMGMGPDPEFADQARRMGVQWVQCGGDFSYMIESVDRLFARVRSAIA